MSWTFGKSFPGYIYAADMNRLVGEVESLAAAVDSMAARIPPPPPTLPALARIYRAAQAADLPIALTGTGTFNIPLATQVDPDQNCSGGPTTFTLTAPGPYYYEAHVQFNQATTGSPVLRVTHGGVQLNSPTITGTTYTLQGVANGYVEAAGASVVLAVAIGSPTAGTTIIGAWLKVLPMVAQ